MYSSTNSCFCFIAQKRIAGVRGFSRETIVALAANIESEAWIPHREEFVNRTSPGKHTDVECILVHCMMVLEKILH